MIFSNYFNKIWRCSPQYNFRQILKKFDGKDAPKPPICCLSTGRVGSQTLAEIAHLSNKLTSYHEPIPKMFALSKHAYELGVKSIDLTGLEGVVKSIKGDIIARSSGGYIETSPQGTFLAPVVRGAYPTSKFIHIVRHPVAVVKSGMRRNWYMGHSHDPTRIIPLNGIHSERWKHYSALQKNIWLWYETNRWIEEFKKKEDLLLIKSEDLFSGDFDVVMRFFNYCGVRAPSERRVQSVLNLKLNSQVSGEFHDYSNWSVDDQQFLIDVAGGLISSYGYSL